MKAKKYFFIIFIVLFIISISVVIYCKANLKPFDYNSYIHSSKYSFISSVYDEVDGIEGWDYESMAQLKTYFIDENVNSSEDLFNLSDYVLIVKTDDTPLYVGEGIINDCQVLKVLKGNDIKVNDVIKIYDLVFYWDTLRTIYLGGNTPLQKNETYIVFLKETKRASLSDTYVYTSVKYGRISLSKERGILKNYKESSLNVQDILEYDRVFSANDDKEVEKYQKIVQQIKDYIKNIEEE